MTAITLIADFEKKGDKGDAAKEARLKRLAIQIAAQLPEDTGDALSVLEHTQTLVRSFLAHSRPA